MIEFFGRGKAVVFIPYAVVNPIVLLMPLILWRILPSLRSSLSGTWLKAVYRVNLALVMFNIPGSLWLHAMGIQYDRFLHLAAGLLTTLLIALCAFAHRSEDPAPEFECRVEGGGLAGATRLGPEDRLHSRTVSIGDLTALVPGEPLRLRIRRLGRGVAYVSASLRTISLGEDLAATSDGIAVERRYFVEAGPQPEVEPGADAAWTPFETGSPIPTGTRLRVVLTLRTPQARNYVLLEDPKPAGFEPIGGAEGERVGACAHVERRDDRTALFFDGIPAGETSIAYVLLAETPGSYHVLPAQAHAMYVPVLRGSSAETRVEVVEATR